MKNIMEYTEMKKLKNKQKNENKIDDNKANSIDQELFKTVNDEKKDDIKITIILIILILIYCLYLIILKNQSFFKIRHELYSWLSCLFIVIIYDFIKYKINIKRKNKIIINGKKLKGKVISSHSTLHNYGKGSSFLTYFYIIELETGKYITAKDYYLDGFDSLIKKECTVYEYKGKYIFTDFR